MSITVASGSTSYGRDPEREPVHCTTTDAGSGIGQLLAEADADAASPDLAFEPLDERAVRTGDGGEAAEMRRPLDELDRVPARGRDPRRLHARRTTAEHDDALRQGGGRVPVRILGLAPARRLADARDDRVADVADLARLVAPGARPDLVGRVARDLRHQIRVGDLGARHLDCVAHGRPIGVVAERPLGLTDVDDRTLQDDRHVDRRSAGSCGTSSMLNPVGSWKSGRVFSDE